jgi:DNA (cytosine-5)-methyltransferase 1
MFSMRTTIDLFAGAGGASIGLRNAGFHHELCIEKDKDAASTLLAAGLPGIHGDVRDLSHYENLKKVDLMWASPPCQAFSTAGKRQGALDERNGWPWTLDVIDHLQSRGIGPEYVICENVPGMTYHVTDCDRSDVLSCAGCYWEGWVQPEFRKRFYWVGTVMLNAADFGVAQHRKRVFLVAGPRPIPWPQKTHCSPDKINQQTMFGPVMKPWVSISSALGIESTIIGGGRNPTPDENDHRTYRDITNEPSTTVAAVQIGNAGPFIVDDKADWWHRSSSLDGPSRTIGTMANASVNDNVRRRLTWRECAKLQGFPDDHPFQGDAKVSLYRQVGNAVCPVVSEVLGQCVMRTMDS